MQPEAYYLVEGIRYETLESANTIAKRFFKRYNQRKDIEVVLVAIDEEGNRHEEVITTYRATKNALVECPNTMDMFS